MSFWDAYNAAWNAGQARDAAGQAAKERAANAAAAQALAGGDIAGATNVFANAGNFDQTAKLIDYAHQQKIEQAKQVADAGLAGVNALSQLPEAERSAYFTSQIAPVLRQHGVPDDQIAQWGSGPMDDQHLQAEAALLGQARQKLEFQGGYAMDPNTGRVVATYPVTVGADSRLFRPNLPGAPGAAGAPDAATAAVSSPSAPVAVPAPTAGIFGRIGQTAAQAGANPAEVAYLQRTAQIESRGDVNARNGSATGLFQYHPQTFAALGGTNIADPDQQTLATLKAARQNAAILQAHGVQVDPATLYLMHQQGPGGGAALLTANPDMNAIQALAPAYKGNMAIARKAIVGNGGTPNMTAGQFVAMWRQKFYRQPAGAAQPVAAPAPAAADETAPPGGTVLLGPNGGGAGGGGHLATPAEVAAAGLPAGTQAWVDAKGKIGDVPANIADQISVGSITTNPDLHGPAFLATIPKPDQQVVKAISEGRMQLPSSFALSKPYWQRIIQAVGQYDPTFDTANPTARIATRKAFSSGPQSQQIVAYNTALGHLDQMDKAIDQLGNSNLNWFNAPSQAFAQASGDAKVQAALANFNTVKGAVSSELVRALRGAGGAEADIKYWQQRFDSAASPSALHAVVQEAVGLLGSRIDAMTTQYNEGMGTTATTVPGLSPTSQAILQRLGGVSAQPAPQQAAAPPQSRQEVYQTVLAARQALRAGAPRAAVEQRLRDNGINPATALGNN